MLPLCWLCVLSECVTHLKRALACFQNIPPLRRYCTFVWATSVLWNCMAAWITWLHFSERYVFLQRDSSSICKRRFCVTCWALLVPSTCATSVLCTWVCYAALTSIGVAASRQQHAS
jgi:hypothetical protein